MDKGNLDTQDRRNLYREIEADNVRVVEVESDETEEMTQPIGDDEHQQALREMADLVRSGRSKIAYVVIKITG